MTQSTGRGKNWTLDETGVLLDKVEIHLPRGGEEWVTVSTDYNITRLQLPTLVSRPERDADSCKTKFKALKNVRKPTGDPTCPPQVKRAKLLHKKIEERISVADFDDDNDEEEDEQELQELQDDERRY